MNSVSQCKSYGLSSKGDSNMSMLSTTLLSDCDVITAFLQDVYQNNLRIIQLIAFSPWSFWFEWVGFLCLYFGLVASMSYIVTEHRKNKALMTYVLPVLVIFNLCIASLHRHPGPTFFFGLLTFVGSMSVFAQLQDCNKEVNTDLPWLIRASSMMFFDTPRRVRRLRIHEERYPSIGKLARGLLYGILIDTCTYLIREYIPMAISAQNQFLFVSLIGGIWVLFCMAFVYFIIETITNLLGYHLPPMMIHHMPLLSVSLAEFWGVRWNPLVGKDLRECFYKPLRLLSVHRGLCMLNTFIGSAILHAWPQYISTIDVLDMIMMFSFFFGQGLAVVLERVFVMMTHTRKEQQTRGMLTVTTPVPSSNDLTAVTSSNGTKQAAKQDTKHDNNNDNNNGKQQAKTPSLHPPPKDVKELRIRQKKAESEAIQHRIKSSPGQLWMELAVMFFIVATCYFTFELKQWTVWSVSTMTTVFVVMSTMQWKLQEEVHQHSFALFEGLAMLVGWWWTIIAIVAMLPLFAQPVLHAVSSVYELSFAAGPVIRLVHCLLPQIRQQAMQ